MILECLLMELFLEGRFEKVFCFLSFSSILLVLSIKMEKLSRKQTQLDSCQHKLNVPLEKGLHSENYLNYSISTYCDRFCDLSLKFLFHFIHNLHLIITHLIIINTRDRRFLVTGFSRNINEAKNILILANFHEIA